MPLCYFDTDAFRHIGTAFRNEAMAPELRRCILVSPITALEVMSQLVTAARAEVLKQIQTMHNWLPYPARIMQMGTYAIADRGFGKTLPDKMHIAITRSLEACFQTRDANQVMKEAGKLRDYLDSWKAKEAQILAQFKKACEDDIKSGLRPPDRIKLEGAIREGLAIRVHEPKTATLVLGLRRIFNAFFEYEVERSLLIGTDRHYNPASPKNINDAFDSEQLVYLCEPTIRFITCDKKYARRVTRSKQAQQIATVESADLIDPARADATIRRIVA